jgi:DNA-binding SARP family transcriptional activator
MVEALEVDGMHISLLGEISVHDAAGEIPLPPSKKARALLGFLAATERPHRRERLCEMFWNVPDDPKAALRWTLTKIRKVVDAPGRARIVADRERVRFVGTDTHMDLNRIRSDLERGENSVSPIWSTWPTALAKGFSTASTVRAISLSTCGLQASAPM